MMGKKRNTAEKTKEISVAIAEASSTAEEVQINTPRKRGRPRKIVSQKELREIIKEEEKKENPIHVAEKQDEDQQKALYPIPLEVEEQTSLMAEKRESSKEEKIRRKARRKGKPHKSS